MGLILKNLLQIKSSQIKGKKNIVHEVVSHKRQTLLRMLVEVTLTCYMLALSLISMLANVTSIIKVLRPH